MNTSAMAETGTETGSAPSSRAPDDFRDLVYAMVRRIPESRVASYGQIAALVGYPKHARLVGSVLKVNFMLPFSFPLFSPFSTLPNPVIVWALRGKGRENRRRGK